MKSTIITIAMATSLVTPDVSFSDTLDIKIATEWELYLYPMLLTVDPDEPKAPFHVATFPLISEKEYVGTFTNLQQCHYTGFYSSSRITERIFRDYLAFSCVPSKFKEETIEYPR